MRRFCSLAMWLLFFSCSVRRGRSDIPSAEAVESLRSLEVRRGFLGDCEEEAGGVSHLRLLLLEGWCVWVVGETGGGETEDHGGALEVCRAGGSAVAAAAVGGSEAAMCCAGGSVVVVGAPSDDEGGGSGGVVVDVDVVCGGGVEGAAVSVVSLAAAASASAAAIEGCSSPGCCCCCSC